MLAPFLAAAWAARPPCWVTAPCAPYDDAGWVVGVGSGASVDAAEDAARAAIAEVFSVRIARTEASRVEARRTAGGDLDRTSTLTVTTTSETERRLQGVRIAERFAGKDGTTWALAVLERGPAADAVRAELAATEARFTAGGDAPPATLPRFGEAGGTAPERVRRLGALLPHAERLATLSEELAVLTGEAAPPAHRWADLARERDAALAALGVAVEADDPWRDALAAVVTGAGLAVSSPGDLALSLHVTERRGAPDPAGFVVITLEGILVVREAGAEVASAPVRAEAASRAPEKARQVAEGKLREELAVAARLLAGVLAPPTEATP